MSFLNLKSPFNIDSLPDELLERIFLLVPKSDLVLRLPCVCKKWHALIENASFWIRLSVSTKKLTHDQAAELSERHFDWTEFGKRIYFYSDVLFKNLLRNSCGDEGFDHWQFSAKEYVQRLSTSQALLKVITNYNPIVNGTKNDWSIEWNNATSYWATERQQGSFEPLYGDKQEILVNFASSYVLGKCI